ncbi:MAG TPA: hypothetical protein VL219_09125 [Steroidobacteraceae bacterium]|jgi:hypothetical protein|nr:hypothetical protein [Steroidobacteraceae bacterium]
MPRRISLSLDAVIVAVTDGRPRVLSTTQAGTGMPALPSGLLDTDGDATLELGLRRWISAQTGLAVGYVEQLYTFGDRDRQRTAEDSRDLSVAYLGLVKEAQPAPGAAWLDGYGLLPWEDHRAGVPPVVARVLHPALTRWAGRDAARQHRVRANFGDRRAWDSVRVLERYELLYEAGLVPEYQRDRGLPFGNGTPIGTELAWDHRRIVATALGRLRGKLKYRPVVFELLSETFTLLQLQRTVEALTGMRLHKQNFRRLVENGHFLEPTRSLERPARGRPAKLFRFRKEVVRARLY